MSPDFESATNEAYGTRITSYWLPGDESAGRAALRHATSSLRVYSDLYGPYPYSDMRVAPAPITYRGMEYPQVILLGVELYGRFRDKTGADRRPRDGPSMVVPDCTQRPDQCTLA